jgi:tetratricopeptide (TPR) repeat protein
MPVRRVSQEKVDLWLTYGDNLFRAGNLPRAEDRYEQALKARPTWSRPRIRLAEIAVARGDYREAAARFREAHAADPGWLVAPDDVQALWPEPRDFAAMLGKIETHLQAHPEDRDAWLVLGAQLLLSGRRDRAADTLVRLTDQPPDPALALLLRASGL